MAESLRPKRGARRGISLLLLAAGAVVEQARGQTYNITDLGTLSGATLSQAYAINASGQITGYSESQGGGTDIGLTDTAFLYSSGSMSSVGTFSGGANSYGTAINTGGTVAGWAYNSSGYANAFFYSSGHGLTNLGTLGGSESFAAAINDSGQVVGDSINSGNNDHAFLYANGTMTDLGTLTGDINSQAFGINNAGTVVGVSYNSSDVAHAFADVNNVMTDLGVPTGDNDSTAYGINSNNQIVGEAGTSSGGVVAFIYANGKFTTLGVPSGDQNSYGYAINDSGEVVGQADDDDGNYTAFVYLNQTIDNLNALINPSSGWNLLGANGINDSGQIVGYGMIDGNEHAFLLTPTSSSQTAVWGLTTGGSWATGANWTGGFSPSGTSATAIFGNTIAAAATVTLDDSWTVGEIEFNSTNSYTLAPGSGGTLTLNNSLGGALVTVVNGNDVISAAVALVGTVTFQIGNVGNTLQLSNVISGTGGLVAFGPGTLLLTANNTYTGPTTIATNGVVQTGTGAGISSTSAIINNGTLILTSNANQNFVGSLSGTGVVQQNGNGTLTFPQTTNYSGGFTVDSGTVVLNTTLNGTAGNVVLGMPQNPNGPQVTTSLGNLTINSSAVIGSFSSTSDNSGADLLTIPAGVTLGDAGGLTVGALNDTTNAAIFVNTLTVTGGGSLVVDGTLTVGQSSNNSAGKDTTTLNLSGLNAFSANNASGTFSVGYGANIKGLLTLANTTVNSVAPSNTINAAQVNVGNSNGGNDAGASFLVLGSGTNVIDTGTLVVGDGKTGGSIGFLSSTSGSVTIAGTGGAGLANIVVGEANGGTEGTHVDGINLAGHNANISAAGVDLGVEEGDSGGAVASGLMTFDTGNFSVQVLALGLNLSGSNSAGAAGTLVLGSSSSSTGILTVTTGFFLGYNTNSGVTAPANGSFVINGGTADIFCNITNYNTFGPVTASTTLAGGTLNMEGYAIGGNGGSLSGNGSVAFQFPASGQTATLMNLSGGGINGAGLMMNGAGALLLGGTNSYSGTTTISSGAVTLISNAAIPSAGVVVNNSVLNVNAAAQAASITGTGSLVVNNSLELAAVGGVSAEVADDRLFG